MLDWNRSALFGGTLQVNELSAGLIDIDHLPPSQGSGGTASLPSPTSAVIALPSLPVALHIGKISTARLRLGKAVLGQEVVAKIDGSADLADGAGAVKLSLVRTDGVEGHVVLDAAFSNATRQLKIDLDTAEAKGGLFASLLGVPDRPALSFSVKGDAPVSDFTATVALATDGQPRLSGTVTTADLADNAGLRFAVDLSGDLAPLVEARYRPFFGADTRLDLGGSYLANGVVTLDRVKLASQELDLDGSLALASDGLPSKFDLTGWVRPAQGAQVLLPIPGAETRIGAAEIEAHFDAAQGQGFTFRTSFHDFARDALKLASGTVTANGTITRTSGQNAVSANVTADLAGLDPGTPDLAAAIGGDLRGKLVLGWTGGGAVTLSDADITAGRARFQGDASFSGLDGNLRITTKSHLTLPDLAPYSGLAGQSLAGAAEAAVDGWYEPLGGAFDVALDASTTGLDLGQGLPWTLVNGDGHFTGGLARGTEGTRFDNLKIETPAISARLSGTVGPAAADVTLAADLHDVAMVYPAMTGPASVKGTLARQGDQLTLDLSGQAPEGITLAGKGTAAADFSAADLMVDAQDRRYRRAGAAVLRPGGGDRPCGAARRPPEPEPRHPGPRRHRPDRGRPGAEGLFRRRDHRQGRRRSGAGQPVHRSGRAVRPGGAGSGAEGPAGGAIAVGDHRRPGRFGHAAGGGGRGARRRPAGDAGPRARDASPTPCWRRGSG